MKYLLTGLLAVTPVAADELLLPPVDAVRYGNNIFITGNNPHAAFVDGPRIPYYFSVSGERESLPTHAVLYLYPGTYKFPEKNVTLHVFEARADLVIGGKLCDEGFASLDVALKFAGDPQRLPALEREIILYEGEKVLETHTRHINEQLLVLEEPVFDDFRLPCDKKFSVQGRSAYQGVELHKTKKIPFK